MKNYTFKGLALMLLCLTMTVMSCKKEDNKAMVPSPPPSPASTVDTYVLTNAGSNSFNVNDTIYMVNSSTMRLTIPVNYGIDTMLVTFDSAFNSTTSVSSFDHELRNNTAYRLIGNVYKNTGNYIQLLFSQRISPYGASNSVQNYNLQYTKL